MSRVLSEMRIDYPSYVWTPSGWIQQMDTTYDESQWNEYPLQVHVVPFSHNDPGKLFAYFILCLTLKVFRAFVSGFLIK